MNPDGSGVWGLSLGASDGEPAWSPDGSRLAVAVRWPGIEGITVMDPDGWTNRSRLTFGYGDRNPAWSPDGARIAYAGADGRIAVVPAAGGSTVKLSSGAGYDSRPAWSPDGKTIAFTRYAETGSEIWVVNVATGAETWVVGGGADGASWSPRGELTYVVEQTAYVLTLGGGVSNCSRT